MDLDPRKQTVFEPLRPSTRFHLTPIARPIRSSRHAGIAVDAPAVIKECITMLTASIARRARPERCRRDSRRSPKREPTEATISRASFPEPQR